nr:hypothetical protein [Tanacetum cinerariifolium]
FDAKGDEGYFVGYSMSSKAFRVFNKRTKKVEDNLHVDFLENKLIEKAEQKESLTVESEFPTVSSPVLTVFLDTSTETTNGSRLISKEDISQEETPSLDNALTLSNRFEDTIGVKADLSNMEPSIPASLTPTFRIHKDHPKSQIIGPVDTLEEPKKIFDALKDPRIRPIGTKWVLKNKKDERGIVIRNKARLVAQGHTQEEVYQMDVKSAFLYGTIDEVVYVMQPPRFQDPEGTIDQTLFIRKHKGDFLLVQVYVDDIIIGSSNPQLCREFEALMHEKFQMSVMGELTFFLDVRSSNTLMDKENPWGKDRPSKDVELHLYRSMIGSLMYLTASRPNIIFDVCACARHQVTPKECHLHAVKRIFKYLKGHPKLGLWYTKESLFDLVAYSDSDYDAATQDRKSTTKVVSFWEED